MAPTTGRKKIIRSEKASNIILAICGENYEDMAKIWHFDPQQQLANASEHLSMISGLIKQKGYLEKHPADLIITHAKSILKYVDPEILHESVSFWLKRLCRDLGRYTPKEELHSERKTQIANDMKAFLLSDEVHPCVNNVAKEYF